MDPKYKERIDDRSAKIGIVGLGYVGLPLVFAFVEQGFHTLGFDIDSDKVDALLSGRTYIKHFPASRIQWLNDSKRFDATTDYSRFAEVDVALLCVPTPLTRQREPNMEYIEKTAESLAPHLKPGALIVLESTTYPGTTRELLTPRFEGAGSKAGEDFFLAYSPEREDPGIAEHAMTKRPKVVGGDTRETLERASYLYEQIVTEVVPVSSTRAAEAVKLTENIFRSVNIALVNELKVVFDRMGIDIWEVIEAAKTKPFGFMPFYPGPGLGGHCIPIDPFYLTWKAREFGSSTRFIELAGEINVSMPHYVIQRLMDALNDRGKPLKNSSILIVGLSYKRDVDDIRESPALVLITLLRGKGAKVHYHDPFVDVVKATRGHPELEGLESVPLTPEVIASHDAVLIATDHSEVDYGELVKHASLVVDTRNATKDVTKGREKIVKA